MKTVMFLTILMLALFTLVACTTMQPLEEDLSNEEIFDSIEPGDEINLVTKTGDQHSITVSVVTEDIIIGGGKQFNIEDIERIEIKKITAAGKTGVVVGGVAVGYLMYVIYSAILLAIVGI